jgi:predicted transcriptional regulator
MAKFQMTSLQKAKHEKAFLLYAEPDHLGKRRSNTAIAQMVGASASAVAYWKNKHNWDAKLINSVEQDLLEADLTNRNIKKALREGLYQHIRTLSRLIEYATLPADKISAIKAFVYVAKELEVLAPDTGTAELTLPPQFKDDVPHGVPDDPPIDPIAEPVPEP